MRVALLSLDPDLPLGGARGASVRMRGLATALARAGHTVCVAVRALGCDEDVAPLRTAGVEVLLLADRLPANGPEGVLGRFQPDLVVERLAPLAAEGALAAASLGVPHLYEVPAPLDRSRACRLAPADEPRALATFTQGFAASGGALTGSEEAARWVRGLAPRDYPVRVLPAGVDPAFSAPPDPGALDLARGDLGPARGFRVAYPGDPRPGHDLAGLVRALGRVRVFAPVQFVLLGDTPARNQLLAQCHEQRVPMALVGSVPHGRLHAFLSACDAVALPCADPEAHVSAIRLLEAMAAGRAVVASATPTVRRVVRDRVDGLLVPAGDVEALASALLRLTRGSELRARLGRAAREAVGARRTWDDVAACVLDFRLACAENAS